MEFSKEDILFEAVNTSELHLIILPTEKCNFNCKYCYEDHNAPRMNQETQDSLITYLRKQLPKLSHLTIDWFGGEPLLELPIIQRVNKFVMGAQKSEDTNFWFRGGITTNGYLLDPDVVEELLQLGVVQYQITLDGTKDFHDTTRVKANGNGSFDKIWKNIIALHERPDDFDVLLRLHLMRSNVDILSDLVEKIENELKNDKRFKLFLKPIKDLGGDGSDFCASESIQDGETVASSMQSSLPTNRSFWSPNPICHASKLNSHIIRADGRIAKCTTALEDPINTIGTLTRDGNLRLDRQKIISWSRGIFEMDEDQLYCPYGGIHQ